MATRRLEFAEVDYDARTRVVTVHENWSQTGPRTCYTLWLDRPVERGEKFPEGTITRQWMDGDGRTDFFTRGPEETVTPDDLPDDVREKLIPAGWKPPAPADPDAQRIDVRLRDSHGCWLRAVITVRGTTVTTEYLRLRSGRKSRRADQTVTLGSEQDARAYVDQLLTDRFIPDGCFISASEGIGSEMLRFGGSMEAVQKAYKETHPNDVRA